MPDPVLQAPTELTDEEKKKAEQAAEVADQEWYAQFMRAKAQKKTKLKWLELAYGNKLDDMKKMLDKKKVHIDCCDDDQTGMSALLLACSMTGTDDMVEWLIKNNANVNCINKYGWTPLLYASTKGSIKHCKMLVAAGAKVNKYPRPGSKQEYLTPIWRALDKRHEEISTFLFENGAWLEPSMHLLTYDEWIKRRHKDIPDDGMCEQFRTDLVNAYIAKNPDEKAKKRPKRDPLPDGVQCEKADPGDRCTFECSKCSRCGKPEFGGGAILCAKRNEKRGEPGPCKFQFQTCKWCNRKEFSVAQPVEAM